MKQIKLECQYADTCLPDYWGGHHLAHVSIPAFPMTLATLKKQLLSEVYDGVIMGSVEHEITASEEWYQAAAKAISEIQRKDPKSRKYFFSDIDEPEDGCDSVYAYFVFVGVS